MPRFARTTGLFTVGAEGDNPSAVRILLSNVHDGPAEVLVTVHRAGTDGAKVVVRQETLPIPARGTVEVTVPSGEAENQRLEVTVQAPNGSDLGGIVPSVAVLTLSDEPELRQWIGPRKFATVSFSDDQDANDSVGAEGDDDGALRSLTTGLIPIDVPGTNGTPPWRYTAHLMLSSFRGSDASVAYRVNSTVEHWGMMNSDPIDAGVVTVPAGGTAIVDVSGIAGATIEVDVDIPASGVQPSLAITRRLPEDGVTQGLLWVGPTAFVPRPGGALPRLRRTTTPLVHRTHLEAPSATTRPHSTQRERHPVRQAVEVPAELVPEPLPAQQALPVRPTRSRRMGLRRKVENR